MNRAAIRQLTRVWLNEPIEGFWTDSELNILINISNQKLNVAIKSLQENFFTISKTFVTTAAIKSYAWPSDFGGIQRLEHYDPVNSSSIEKVDVLSWPRSEAGGGWPFGQSGKPQRYIPFGDHFDLLPIPDAAYTMRIYYDQVKNDLSVDTDIPSSPVEFHDMIACYATILALPKNQADSTEFKAIWDNREADLIRHIEQRKGSDPQTVEGYLEGVI